MFALVASATSVFTPAWPVGGEGAEHMYHASLQLLTSVICVIRSHFLWNCSTWNQLFLSVHDIQYLPPAVSHFFPRNDSMIWMIEFNMFLDPSSTVVLCTGISRCGLEELQCWRAALGRTPNLSEKRCWKCDERHLALAAAAATQRVESTSGARQAGFCSHSGSAQWTVDYRSWWEHTVKSRSLLHTQHVDRTDFESALYGPSLHGWSW